MDFGRLYEILLGVISGLITGGNFSLCLGNFDNSVLTFNSLIYFSIALSDTLPKASN